MRVLLDAHVSGRHVGRPLRRAGHDVLALDEDARLSRLRDPDVLALAEEECRIVITCNLGDFIRIARKWGEAGRIHAGLILVPDAHLDYGTILRRLEQMFAARPDQADWTGVVEFLGHG